MQRFPYSIVWTPLPVITFLIPIIGHTGIADSEGVIYDFGGSYNVAVDNFTFGRPTKFLKLDESKVKFGSWNEAIQLIADKYRTQQHNIFFNNCHKHVADSLNKMKYDGKDNYSEFDVFLMITFNSSYTDIPGFVKQWGVFMIILFLAVILLCLK